MSAPKVVRTTVDALLGFEGVNDAFDGWAGPVVVVPASDYDRMVEREREARSLIREALFLEDARTSAGEVSNVLGSQWVDDARTFLAGETKGESDGK
jgi:hypothetical protein